MAIKATYREIQAAVMALRALGSKPLGLDKEGKPAPIVLPIKTILKAKRMLGLLTPLAVQAEETQQELVAAAKLAEGAPPPPALVKKVQELWNTSCEVGADQFGMGDLAGVETAQMALASVLADLGPFWTDD